MQPKFLISFVWNVNPSCVVCAIHVTKVSICIDIEFCFFISKLKLKLKNALNLNILLSFDNFYEFM